MEGLGRKIRQAKVVCSVKGLQLFEHGHVLTHQQFVDDTMLQGIPTVKEALAYKQILKDFAMASDKVKKWTYRSLNLAGGLVLTKAILQSITAFMLSILPAPQSVLHQLRSIQRDFLWGKGKEHKKWALVAWDKISKPKSFVGLGLNDPDLLSKVLGAKLWWR
eukprot:PITA_08109